MGGFLERLFGDIENYPTLPNLAKNGMAKLGKNTGQKYSNIVDKFVDRLFKNNNGTK